MLNLLLLFWHKSIKSSVKHYNFKMLMLFFLLVWFSSSGFLYFEMVSKPDLKWYDAVWWTLVTMTTVGYGDYFPTTFGGRYLIGVPTLIFGIGFLSYLISIVASSILDFRLRRIKGMTEMKNKDHVLIINNSNTERLVSLVKELQADITTRHKFICLVDEFLEELPVELLDLGVSFVKGNPSKESVLLRANVKEASHAIILSSDLNNAHSDDHNLSVLLVLEHLNSNIYSVVEIIDFQKSHHFEIAGANSVVCMSNFAVNLIVHELQYPGVQSIIKNIIDYSEGEEIYFIPIKKMKEWTYKELVLWGLDRNFSIIGIIKNGKIIYSCSANEKLAPNDKAIVISLERVKEIVI